MFLMFVGSERFRQHPETHERQGYKATLHGIRRLSSNQRVEKLNTVTLWKRWPGFNSVEGNFG